MTMFFPTGSPHSFSKKYQFNYSSTNLFLSYCKNIQIRMGYDMKRRVIAEDRGI